MKKNRIEKVDRISESSEPILHHILSFLPFKQVAQTTLLSKRWETVWLTFPVLEFDRTIFKPHFQNDHTQNNEECDEVQKRRKKLFNCLGKTLQDRWCKETMSIKEFTLEIDLFNDPEFVTFVDGCVCVSYAIRSNV